MVHLNRRWIGDRRTRSMHLPDFIASSGVVARNHERVDVRFVPIGKIFVLHNFCKQGVGGFQAFRQHSRLTLRHVPGLVARTVSPEDRRPGASPVRMAQRAKQLFVRCVDFRGQNKLHRDAAQQRKEISRCDLLAGCHAFEKSIALRSHVNVEREYLS